MSVFISATHDVVFKALFVRNPELLKPFISDVLEEPLNEKDRVLILNPLPPDSCFFGRFATLEVKVEATDRDFFAGFQGVKSKYNPERAFQCWTHLYREQVRLGESVDTLKKTYWTSFVDDKRFDCAEYRSDFSFRNVKTNEPLSDVMNVVLFELPKVPNDPVPGDNQQKWLALLKADSPEALRQVKELYPDPSVQKAADAILEINADDSLRCRISVRDDMFGFRDYVGSDEE